MGCSCSIDVGLDWDTILRGFTEFRKARVVHHCYECDRDIRKGERYERFFGTRDGDIHSYKTCLDCASVRDSLFCTWIYGSIWEELINDFSESHMIPSSECMMQMTKAGRDKVCDLLEEAWKEME